jgi:hypothetical protein
MESFAQFIQVLHLGFVDDPHGNKRMPLTERVTVCPSCQSLHSLRKDARRVHCVECTWTTGQREPAVAA